MEKVSAQVLGEVLGISGRMVRTLRSSGVLKGENVNKTWMFDLPKSVQAFVAYQISLNSMNETEKSKLDAEARLKTAKAITAELEAAELQGKMHRSEDVEAVFNDLVYTVRNALIALPGRLAVDVTGAKTSAEAAVIIRREVNNVLTALSEYKYDPADYEKRVRERRKWTEKDEEPD
jgi:phage terminase Nu1 subunit (DNA packaging protein)